MGKKRFGVIVDELFTRHATPHGHPESPDRVRSVMKALHAWNGWQGLEQLPPAKAETGAVLLVHSPRLVEQVRLTSGIPFTSLDPDTYTSANSFDVALTAVGSATKLVDALYSGQIDQGFLVARPPGHHAETDRAMGFCLFNTVAVAAQWAVKERGAKRVAIVDFDVHHGNGTQEIFYSRPDVLYISSHQYPFYPGTGDFGEVGDLDGTGYTLNFPVPAGTGDYFLSSVYREIAAPVLEAFAPDLILVSAGYDAHRDDPLGGLRLGDAGFGVIVSSLLETAERICGGRLLFFLEGGYNLEALARCVVRTIEGCIRPIQWTVPPDPSSQFADYKARAVARFSSHWSCLG